MYDFPLKKVRDLIVEDCNKIGVSICCITFNHGNFIKTTIESFLDQEVTFGVEILIHDDCSSDDTSAIIKSYEKHYPHIIKPIIQKENQWSQGKRSINVRFNYNRAIGKYIAYCEGDDYWVYSKKLLEQVTFLDQHAEVAFCYHEVNKVDFNGDCIVEGQKQEIKVYDSEEIIHTNITPLTLLFRNFDFVLNENLLSCLNGDIVLITFLASKGKGANLGDVWGNYRIHNLGVYSSQGLLLNTINSIDTRQRIIKYGKLSESLKLELEKNIIYRKKKAIKAFFKKLDFISIFKLLLNK